VSSSAYACTCRFSEAVEGWGLSSCRAPGAGFAGGGGGAASGERGTCCIGALEELDLESAFWTCCGLPGDQNPQPPADGVTGTECVD